MRLMSDPKEHLQKADADPNLDFLAKPQPAELYNCRFRLGVPQACANHMQKHQARNYETNQHMLLAQTWDEATSSLPQEQPSL